MERSSKILANASQDHHFNEFVFVIKVSKFCNLRCVYCYEHSELHLRQSMSLATVQRIFEDVDRFGRYLSERGVCPKFSFVWHGGEPLLQRSDYYRRITDMQRKYIREFDYSNSVQTNLYSILDDTLRFILDSNWTLSVSIDFVSDIRRNAGRKDSNATVIGAAQQLFSSGIHFGVISVLGAHNVASIVDAYDWLSRFATGWRILPVFEGGPNSEVSSLRLSDENIIRTLVEVFLRRANSPRHIPIEPLDYYLKCAALKIVNHRRHVDFVQSQLDNIYVVNVNGDIFTRPFAYDPSFCLGNVNRSSMQDLIQRDTYVACQQKIQTRKDRNCLNCNIVGFCDTSPMHEHGTVTATEECAFPKGTILAIEQQLQAAGVDREVIVGWTRSGRQ